MNIYEEYAKTKQAIKALELKLDELEPQILEEIKLLSAPMKTDFGTFTTKTRVIYKFSTELVEKEKQVKEEIKTLQQKEIETGKAEKEEKTGVMFIEKKI